MYSINMDGYVSNLDGVLVASELHLQHPLKAPAHERRMREP